jgi:hypothetical protein
VREFVTIAGTAGALAGDVPSLARWAHRLFGGRILSAASLREMSRFHEGAFWQGYDHGLARDSGDGRPMIGHEGDGVGSRSELWHLTRENQRWFGTTTSSDAMPEPCPRWCARRSATSVESTGAAHPPPMGERRRDGGNGSPGLPRSASCGVRCSGVGSLIAPGISTGAYRRELACPETRWDGVQDGRTLEGMAHPGGSASP